MLVFTIASIYSKEVDSYKINPGEKAATSIQ